MSAPVKKPPPFLKKRPTVFFETTALPKKKPFLAKNKKYKKSINL